MPRHLTLTTSREPTIQRLTRPLPRPIQEHGWSHTLVLTGRLDDTSAADLDEEIECLCQEGVQHLTLDLRQLEELDAEGLNSIASSCSRYRRRGQSFAVIAGSPAVRHALAEAGVSEALTAEAGDLAARSHHEAMSVGMGPDLTTTTVRTL